MSSPVEHDSPNDTSVDDASVVELTPRLDEEDDKVLVPPPLQRLLKPLDILDKSLAWWREFYQIAHQYPDYAKNALWAQDEAAFCNALMLNEDDAKQFENTYVLHFSYDPYYAAGVWEEYIWITKQSYDLIQAYLEEHPNFEIDLGSISGKYSDVRVRWDDLLEEEFGPDARTVNDAIVSHAVYRNGDGPFDWNDKDEFGAPNNWEDSRVLMRFCYSDEFKAFASTWMSKHGQTQPIGDVVE